MTRARLITSIAGVAVALIGGFVWRVLREPSPTLAADITTAPQQPTVFAETPPASTPSDDIPTGAPAAVQGPAANFEATFKESRDVLAFAESIVDAARAGDGAARFWMYQALSECTTDFRTLFAKENGEVRSLEESLAERADYFFTEDSIRESYTRCRRFRESNPKGLGEAQTWLLTAVESKNPRAQVERARLLAVNATYGAENPEDLRSESRRLASEALRSRDPAVIAEVGRVGAQIAPHDSTLADSWLMAACARGLDCTSSTDTFEVWCIRDLACQPFESIVDVMRRAYGNEFAAIESRAREINDSVDAGRFDELDF
jgi:hypothetical protein